MNLIDLFYNIEPSKSEKDGKYIVEKIQPDYFFIPPNLQTIVWGYSWTVSPGLVSQFSSIPSYADKKITATVSGTNRYGVPISSSASRTFSAGASRIYFDNNICKCEGVSPGDTATISGTTYTVVDNASIRTQVGSGII